MNYPLHIDAPPRKNRSSQDDDTPLDMTFSRRAARYLARYSFYNPNGYAAATSGNTNGARISMEDYYSGTSLNPPPPNLDAAWEHYEHVTLPRRFIVDDANSNNNNSESCYTRAPQSQRCIHNTQLYPIWETPLRELNHFGVSIRMFFSTLLVLSGTLLLAGLLNLPMMVYFWNYASNGNNDGSNGSNKEGVEYMGIGKMIRASALCDATEWVVCDDCQNYANEFPSYRMSVENGVAYVRHNLCNFEDWYLPGLCSFIASLLVLALSAFFFFGKQRQAEIVFDEAIQTASDYSIKINNPPKDALDPEEWRIFFNQYVDEKYNYYNPTQEIEWDQNDCDSDKRSRGGGVVLVTIAIDNADLLKTLILRRKKLEGLAKLISHGTTKMKNMNVIEAAVVEASVALSTSLAKRTYRFLANLLYLPPNDPITLWSDIVKLENDIRDMTQRQYSAVSVFVTFDSERSQRNALHALSTGKLNVWRNQLARHRESNLQKGGRLTVKESIQSSNLWDFSEAVQEERTIQLATSAASTDSCSRCLLFRGERVLRVKEANEPNDVRWIDLQASSRRRLELHLASAFGMMMFVALSGMFIFRLAKNYPGHYAAIFITLTNTIVPIVCELINDLESHPTEHGQQISLYVKMTLFRWFNSAIALSVISTFIETISVEDGNEYLQQSLMYKVYPVIVAELFCNPIIQILDLPENFRKHVLAPRTKDQAEMNACFTGGRFWLAERYTNANRVLFVALFFSSILPEALFLGSMALMAQYFVGKFSLLRLCGPTPDVGFHLSRLSRNYFIPAVLITHVVMSAYWWSGYPYDSVCEKNNDNGEGGYSYCNQNMYGSNIFPPLPRFQPEDAKWMTQSQATLTSLYGWTSVVVLMIAAYTFLRYKVIPWIRSLYESTYVPDGMDQGIAFTKVTHRDEVHGYIPQALVKGFCFPLIACDIQGIDEDLIGWKDKEHGYQPHNLVHDVQTITESNVVLPVFSIVRQWNPNKAS